ncbi:hypothetical protein TrST_g12032 [Triparma strigata]|uniref:Uncharacterized protein n=1 Tax=Triparma strigata TaxID=1606541 RepID=A0A9W7E2D9_9STRA|nr:hypothetical protein TrST_g12032 [Triparma strigata]
MAITGQDGRVDESLRRLQTQVKKLRAENAELRKQIPPQAPSVGEEGKQLPQQDQPPSAKTKDQERRRMSIALGEDFGGTSLLDSSLALVPITTPLSKASVSELVQSFIDAVKLSHGNIKADISDWFKKEFPSYDGNPQLKAALDNFQSILIEVAKKLRPLIKMSRIGLGVRLFVIAICSYVDMATDLLVSFSFFEKGETGWGTASLSFVSAGILAQTLVAWMQYRGQATKDEYRADSVTTLHPLYWHKNLVQDWILNLPSNYDTSSPPPKFMTQKFESHIIDIFKWWGGGEDLVAVEAALNKFETFVPPKVETQKSGKTTKRFKSNNKIAPAKEN